MLKSIIRIIFGVQNIIHFYRRLCVGANRKVFSCEIIWDVHEIICFYRLQCRQIGTGPYALPTSVPESPSSLTVQKHTRLLDS